MSLSHRPVTENDLQIICGFPQNAPELFFLFPKADFPLAPSQLQEAIAQRSDSTVVELDSEVVAFANFYRSETDGVCSIGNVIVSPEGVESVAISSSTWCTSLSQNTWQRRLQCPASIKTLQVCCFTQNLGFSHTLSRNGKTRKETRLHSFTYGCYEMQPNIPVGARLRRWASPPL